MGAVAKRTQSGDMVGVQMRVGGLDQLEIKLAYELQVAVDLLKNGIDDQRLTAMPACDKISVGTGNAVEELAEYHWRLRSTNLFTGPAARCGYRVAAPSSLVGKSSWRPCH